MKEKIKITKWSLLIWFFIGIFMGVVLGLRTPIEPVPYYQPAQAEVQQ